MHESALKEAPAVAKPESAKELNGRRAYALLGAILALAGFLFLVGNGDVGLWDRDEPRYAQTSKQMLQSSPADWVVPRLLGEIRTAKPVFIYWAQALSMKVLGSTGEFAARLPSAVAMLITLAILAIAIGKAMGWQRGLWTAFILATTGLTIAAAKMCITDSVLLLFIVIAQLCLYAIYAGNRSIWVLVGMWVAIGLAALTKGPVVVGVQVMTMLALSGLDVAKRWREGRAWKEAMRWWYHTHPWLGILIVAAVCGPWVVLLQMRAPDFLRTAFWHDIVARTRGPLEGHKGPPGYYLLTVWGTFFPWSLLLVTGLVTAWKHRGLPAIRFALAAAIGPWVLMEIVQTKLVHYVMPAFPALAFLTADALVRCIRREQDDLHRPLAWKAAAFWALATAAAGFAPWIATRHFENLPTRLFTVFSIAGIVYGAVVLFLFARRKIAQAAVAMGVGMVVVIAIFWGVMLPRLHFLWVPRQVAAVLQREGATHVGDALMLDYDEDSLAYYQGGTIRSPRMLGDERVGWLKWFETPRAQGVRWMVLTEELWEKLPATKRAQFVVVEKVKGWRYAARGKIVTVVVIRRR